MVLRAVGLALVVTVAVRLALDAPFLADVVGEGLAVLGQVGGEAVGADAGVGEGGGFAVVLVGDAGGGLEADSDGDVLSVECSLFALLSLRWSCCVCGCRRLGVSCTLFGNQGWAISVS